MSKKSELFTTRNCYDILPQSFKMIVFDNTLLLKKALAVLLQHGVQSAPVWDSKQQRFIGMLTVTDFIQLIVYYFDRSTSLEEALQEIDEMTIARLRENQVLKCLPIKSFTVSPTDSLLTASQMLITNHLHRLPILETTEHSDTILSVLTQSKILRYIATHESNRDYMNQTIADLKLGTFTNLITAESDTPLIEILRLFLSRHISSIPIVDEHNQVLNVYEKYDVLMLAKDGPYYNLDMPVSDALQKRSTDFTGIHSCSLQDTLGQILQSIKAGPVMRFVVLDNGKLAGILSLSDILKYLINQK